MASSISFQVPWGVVEGLTWGKKSGRPVLGLHGWLDNANTFYNLAPLLPEDIFLVVMEFPGHGKSSQRPPGTPYTFLDWVIDVRRVVLQLEWKSFSFIGHSMGASVAALYAGTFPDEVRELILLEYRGPSVASEKRASEVLAMYANDLVTQLSKKRSYSEYSDLDAVVSRLMKGNPELISTSAKLLAERSVHAAEGGVALRIDSRLKPALIRDVRGNYLILTQSMLNAIISNISCSVLVVRGNACHPLFRIQDNLIRERFAVIKRSAKLYKYFEVPGNHFVHLNNAPVVANEIRTFLDRLTG